MRSFCFECMMRDGSVSPCDALLPPFRIEFESLLELLPDDIDLRVVRDRFERNVWDALLDEALPDTHGSLRR